MLWYDSANQVSLIEVPYLNSIYLLGTASDGPVNKPIEALNPSQVEAQFGTGGTLYQGYMQVHSTELPVRCFLVRVSGKYAKTWYQINGKKALSLRARGAGVKYNNVKAVIEDLTYGDGTIEKALVIYPTEGLGREIAYFLKDFPTLGLLTAAINADTSLQEVCVYANTVLPEGSSSLLASDLSEKVLIDGDDEIGLSKNDMFLALERSYETLGGRIGGIVVPLGVYFDDVCDPYYYGGGAYGETYYTREGDLLDLFDTVANERCTFHGQLINFCRLQQRFGKITHGVLGLNPFNDEVVAQMPELGFDYVTSLVNTTAFANREGLYDQNGAQVIDKGFYISIFAGDIRFSHGGNTYWANGAPVYAAMIARFGLETTSNKPLPAGLPYRPALQSQELKMLATIGVVTCRDSALVGGPVVHNGVTAGLFTGELHSIANVMMVQYTVWRLNAIFQEYVGKDLVPDQVPIIIKTINDDAIKVLEGLKNQGIILGYTLNITPTTSTWWSCQLTLAGKYTVEDINVPLGINFG